MTGQKLQSNKKRPDGEAKERYDFSYTQNRELSWLQFDMRVLEEAMDPTVPLLERFKMASIFESNLDEFIMIRVGSLTELASLKRTPIDNKSNQTPSQQLESVYEALPKLTAKHGEVVAELESALRDRGIERVGWAQMTAEDKKVVEAYYTKNVLPVASPQIVDPRHPFPNLRNDTLYAVFNLASAKEAGLLGLIEIPTALPRVVDIKNTGKTPRYILLEDVILACAEGVFGEYHTSERAVVRVTRNADIDPDEGSFDMEDDYRQHIKKVLKQRLRLNPVRLEVQGKFGKSLVKHMRKSLHLEERQVFQVSGPLSMGDFAFSLEGKLSHQLASELTYPPFSPQAPACIDPDRPVHEQIEEHDILLAYPYDSMEPFLRLLHESANDPDVVQIKITLYRVATQSKLCEALIAASENGVDVTVVMELRARFDEENNIEWAERLEDAGCTVLYGSAGFKVHSKICQITRRKGGEVTRITQLGTGNYNEKTARLYCDYSFMTCDPRIGEDANKFFRNMQIGKLDGDYQYLGVAPVGLKPLIMKGIDREIAKARAGEEAHVWLKMNSITDREVIDKISEASCVGVKVDLIVRGICCLVPGVPGKTENVTVRCIVGRMLEHARVYMFGTERDIIYLSSADMMTRNTEHRVEIAFPLLNPDIRTRVAEDFDIQMADNLKARVLTSKGLHVKVDKAEDEPSLGAQNFFMERARRESEEAAEKRADDQRERRRRIVPTASAAPELPEAAEEREVEPAAIETEIADTAGEAPADEETEAVSETVVEVDSASPEDTAQGGGADHEDSAEAMQPLEAEPIPGEPEDAADAKPDDAEVPDTEAERAPEPPATEPPTPETPSVEAVVVEAEPIEHPADKAEEPKDPVEALELMVVQKGRLATGWALIKAGIRVLLGKSISK